MSTTQATYIWIIDKVRYSYSTCKYYRFFLNKIFHLVQNDRDKIEWVELGNVRFVE